ncbi:hypothetical protein PybrP1_005175 [[Pythium] brassicae (nom. inval.)]|nr:hypothetical protein PybrP1_005175 [[Pythium] brassicae (nom. inval.)]
MDEIALLQAQLAAVQQQESALKLSDHNVIDLLARLQQLGRLQVVHTLTGKQFLTPAQIERELRDFVALGGGRASISELQQLLNIDRVYVERHVAQLTRSRRGGGGTSYYVVNSGEEVVTSGYLDAIMEDTNTLLQETGTTTIGELAQQYGFAVDYMKDVVLARLGSILRAQERHNVLYTHSFVASQKAQIRGVFCAATRPTFVPDVVRAHRFEERVVDECLLELLQRRVLMGTLRGREYVPYVFVEAQRESMYSFFQQNGFLDHARALQLQVARPYDFLKRRFPDAVPLERCVVSHALRLQVDGAVEAAVNDASCVDVLTVLPSALPTSDVALLLAKSPLVAASAAPALQIRDVFAVSRAFVDAATARLQQDANAKAARAASAASAAGAAALPSARRDASAAHFDQDDDRGGESDDDVGSKRGGKRGKKGGGGGAKPSEDDRKSKGGKGGKAAKGRKGGDEASRPLKRSDSVTAIVPSRVELQQLLASWFPLLDDDEELLAGVVEHLAARVDAMYAAALSAALANLLRGDAASQRERRKAFDDTFDDLLTRLLVFDKGFRKLAASADAVADAAPQLQAVESHILRTAGVALAAAATRFVAEMHALEMDGVVPPPRDAAASEAPLMTTLSDANKKVLENNLPAATASAIVRLWTLAVAGRRSLADLLMHVPVVADALSVPLRKLDRKKERQVVFGYRHAVAAELERADECARVAPTAALVLQLFFQQATGLPATFPTDSLVFGSVVLDAFRASTPAAPMAALDALLSLAQALGDDAASAENARARGWPELVAQARALVLAKDIASA